MRGLIVCAVVVLAQWSGAASAFTSSCSVPYIRTLNNQTVSGHMYVRSGKRCSIILQRSVGPTFTAHIVQNARMGNMSIDGHRVIYRSRPGYLGEDHFTYARKGLDTLNRPVVRTVEITVHVEAK